MPQGLVTKTTGSWYYVLFENQIYACKIKGNFRLKGIKSSTPVTVGDIVEFDINPSEKIGLITEIQPRKNYIIRKATRFHHESHLIAANIDQAFLMVSLKSPATPLEFVDRFLLAAEMFFIPVKIIINKTDLVDQNSVDDFSEIYNKAGYECIPMSITANMGVKEVHNLMKNKLTLISGNSGVGKSSLIKAINPEIEIKIDEISDYHQSGKHTTTFSEIFKLTDNCLIIDTPGIKSFGIIDIEKNEIGIYFKDIFHSSKECKFYNCTHLHEPGCSVIEAVKNNIISKSRYRSYVNIFTDEGEKHR
jgi:ribosome biogenesis GTPase / thiamine phosphate phosphatase